MAGYASAKRRIFANQTAEDTAVVGIDDALSREMTAGLPGRVVTVSGSGAADFAPEGSWLRGPGGRIVDLATARALPGAHNMQNAAAAAAMARALGVPDAAIAKGIASYPGLPHRQEKVGEIGGVVFVNDSKATNADSSAWALGCYERVIWIAGGEAKEGGIEPLAAFFPRVALALLIGRDAPVLAATLAAHGVAHRIVGTLAAATEEAAEEARKGVAPVVLLSPACASWDQFTGFDQRGDMFRAQVREIAGEAP
jgi:UDP-N-acetylmuramoylalanine--D-glutamate ligase